MGPASAEPAGGGVPAEGTDVKREASHASTEALFRNPDGPATVPERTLEDNGFALANGRLYFI